MENKKAAMQNASSRAGQELKKQKKEYLEEISKRTLSGNLSMKALAGVSDEKEESIYAHAYQLYNTGRYKDATPIFRLLITINSTEPKYMMGLAACFHMLKAYDAAISAYTLVSFLDPQNPVPYFHLSDCALQAGDKIAAAVALDMAVKRAEGKPEFSVLKERCDITLKGLKKELAAK